MDKKTNDFENIEYTIVMDPAFPLTEDGKPEPAAGGADKAKRDAGDAPDKLYAEYERMWLSEPTVLDRDDVYPHSYQWRMVAKDDPAKLALIREALKERKKIADTDAYQEFLEDVKKRGLGTGSWE